MGDVAAPTKPVLATIPGVELIRCGTWAISTGEWTVDTGDLEQAIAAQACPAVRRPVLKLGHSDPRFSGEPAVGYVDNLALADQGQTLVGDYVGMPAWLADVAASAYPDRSVEGMYDFVCQQGHTHPFVLTAVALLGVTAPGVGNLESLQDIAALYGVAAATPGHGQHITASVPGGAMPAPVHAAVTSEDVRRAYNDSEASWSRWVCEVQLDPPKVIVCDDASGDLFEQDIVISGDTVTFGDPVEVRKTYVPVTDVAAARPAAVTTYASREASRPGTQAPAATPAPGSEKGAGMDPAKLREDLGLSADASTIEVAAAMAAAGLIPAMAPAEADPVDDKHEDQVPVAASIPEPVARELERQSRELAEIKAARDADTKRGVIEAAIADGKIRPADRKTWEADYDEAPGVVTAMLGRMARGSAVPVAASGYSGEGDELDDVAEFDRLHSRPVPQEV